MLFCPMAWQSVVCNRVYCPFNALEKNHVQDIYIYIDIDTDILRSMCVPYFARVLPKHALAEGQDGTIIIVTGCTILSQIHVERKNVLYVITMWLCSKCGMIDFGLMNFCR